MKLSSIFNNYESIIAAGAGVIPTLISWWWPSNTPVPLFVYIATVYVLLTIIWLVVVRQKIDLSNVTSKHFVIVHIDWEQERLIMRNIQLCPLEIGQCFTLKVIDEEGYRVPIALISISEIDGGKCQANLLLIGNVKIAAELKDKPLDRFVITDMINHQVIERIARVEE